MDYSQLPSDPDSLAGGSPWQTSPQRPSRQSYSTSASGSEPSSPTATQSPYRSESQRALQEDISDHEVGGKNGDRTAIAEGQSGAQSTTVTPGRQQSHSPQPPRQPESSQRHSIPSRYQAGGRPTERQKAAQYKLQAKITGLERTAGKKDPTIRFDVHVCSLPHLLTKRI